jgi:hypothetical protein
LEIKRDTPSGRKTFYLRRPRGHLLYSSIRCILVETLRHRIEESETARFSGRAKIANGEVAITSLKILPPHEAYC